MAHYAEIANTLRLIATGRGRRPARALAELDEQFRRLAASRAADEALETEERIWNLWMFHPHRRAAEALEAATRDIAAQRYDIAETRLTALVRHAPEFSEAWQKRATLYYLLGRDEEGVHDIGRTLSLEPRHFGALLHLGEILLGAGEGGEARFAFFSALLLHPHLSRAREVLAES
jgi:tetratricopeptide (TPR) repeat protein